MRRSNKRKVAVMTGTRAEYGLLRGVMKRILASQSMKLQVIVTGTHVSHHFGHTMDEILRDGFKIDSIIRILSQEDSGLGMALSLGKSIKELAISLSKLRPDILVVLGDRFEVLAATLAATYLNIPVAHLHGGDVSGGVDQPVRYATSKLCHIHFVASAQAAMQLKKIGEDDKRIFIVGAPGLDEILEKNYTTSKDLERKYDIDINKPLLILLQHPVVTEEESVWQLIQTLEAVKAIGIQTVVIYPNADAGGMRMIAEIKKYSRKHRFLKPVQSMPRTDFLGLMSIADAMVGNSSSAVIEAPSFRLPVVNIGTRQLGRQRAGYVRDVGHDAQKIQQAILKALRGGHSLGKGARTKSPYGDGRSSERIVRILQDIDLNKFWPKR